MSAELLRQAASLMRERAEAATPGPWMVTPNTAPTHYVHPEGRVVTTGLADDQADEIADTFMHCDSVHIASWAPAVALVISDILEREGEAWQRTIADHPDLADAAEVQIEASGWTRVARAYLGVSS